MRPGQHATEGPDGPAASSRGPGLGEGLAAALILALLASVFLREPILHYGDSVFAPADYLQQFSLTRVPGMGLPRNFLMGDAIQQYIPWTLFNRAELARGHIPLWNPYNGCGTPHLAAYQPAVFSPFSVPFYILPLKAALIASAYLRLMALGLFTFLFLRRLGLAWTAALTGGVLYAFAGYHLVWLGGPESGTSAAVPASLFFAETALQRLERGARSANLAGPLAGLTLSLAAGLLAGHPETFLIGLLILAAFIAFRMAEKGSSSAAERFRRMAFPLIVAGLLAAGLASVQIVPFLEYLAHSSVGLARAAIRPRGFVLPYLPVQLFPYLLGGPPRAHNYMSFVAGTTFNEEAGGFVGPLALLLFGAGAVIARKDRRMRFFLAVAVIWFLWAYDVPFVSALLNFIPPLGTIADGRSTTAWILCVSTGAAFGVDSFVKLPRRSLPRALSGALAGGAALLGAGAGGASLLFHRLGTKNASAATACKAAFPADFRAAALWLALGMAAVALYAISSGRVARALAGSLLAGAAYMQGGEVLSRYNPTVPASLLYARTPAITGLRNLPPGTRLLFLGRDNVPADANMGFGLTQASSYDGLWVARYDSLYVSQFTAGSWIRNAKRFSNRDLDLFGIGAVVVPAGLAPHLDTRGLDRLPLTGNFDLLRNGGGPGRFWMAARAIPAESAKSSEDVVRFGDFDPRTDVVIEASLDLVAGLTDLAAHGPPGLARLLSEEPEHVKLDVNGASRGILVATIAWYPGWHAFVDGRRAPIYPANAAFLGIPVAAGHHIVDLRYEPVSWKIGVAISAASLMIGLVLLRRPRRVAGTA